MLYVIIGFAFGMLITCFTIFFIVPPDNLFYGAPDDEIERLRATRELMDKEIRSARHFYFHTLKMPANTPLAQIFNNLLRSNGTYEETIDMDDNQATSDAFIAKIKAGALESGIMRIEESLPPHATPWDCINALRKLIAELRNHANVNVGTPGHADWAAKPCTCDGRCDGFCLTKEGGK